MRAFVRAFVREFVRDFERLCVCMCVWACVIVRKYPFRVIVRKHPFRVRGCVVARVRLRAWAITIGSHAYGSIILARYQYSAVTTY